VPVPEGGSSKKDWVMIGESIMVYRLRQVEIKIRNDVRIMEALG